VLSLRKALVPGTEVPLVVERIARLAPKRPDTLGNSIKIARAGLRLQVRRTRFRMVLVRPGDEFIGSSRMLALVVETIMFLMLCMCYVWVRRELHSAIVNIYMMTVMLMGADV